MRARLRTQGVRVGKTRTLRVTREHELLPPVRQGHARGDRSHSGTERPRELWGTDAIRF